MYKSGLDPEALSGFFYRLKEQGEEIPEYLSWFSTHPGHDERINAIKKIVADLPETDHKTLPVNWEKLHDSVEGR
jgi:predicted Zn-dependent protease